MDETKIPKGKCQWKHRRSRSTSNLAGATVGTIPVNGTVRTDSDDTTGIDGNDSDDAQRSFARLSLQTGKPKNVNGSRNLRARAAAILTTTPIESDSFNDIFPATSGPAISGIMVSQQQSCRRRRRNKRMAIDCTESQIPVMDVDVFKQPLRNTLGRDLNEHVGGVKGIQRAVEVIDKVPSHSREHCRRTRTGSGSIGLLTSFDLESGKRKRGGLIGREKSNSESAGYPIASCSTDFQSMIGIGMELMNIDLSNEDEVDEIMKCDDDEVSSLSSESIAPSCDDGQDGDDEQSDWVGDEWKEDMGESERRDLMIRRLRDYVPSREIRAGKRRVHPEKPPFSTRTYANEQISKFLQDPAQSQLRLHRLRRDERVQLGHIASLYSLRLHSDECGGFPVLTKTPNTTQVNPSNFEVTCSFAFHSDQIRQESESDSKRIKKSD